MTARLWDIGQPGSYVDELRTCGATYSAQALTVSRAVGERERTVAPLFGSPRLARNPALLTDATTIGSFMR